jgi:geranylgeranyl transferase type-2 subunit beta
VSPTHTEHAGSQNKDDLTYHMTAHLRMNAVYWGVTALCIMKHKEALDAEETIQYVMSCWDEEAGAPPLSFSQAASHY